MPASANQQVESDLWSRLLTAVRGIEKTIGCKPLGLYLHGCMSISNGKGAACIVPENSTPLALQDSARNRHVDIEHPCESGLSGTSFEFHSCCEAWRDTTVVFRQACPGPVSTTSWQLAIFCSKQRSDLSGQVVLGQDRKLPQLRICCSGLIAAQEGEGCWCLYNKSTRAPSYLLRWYLRQKRQNARRLLTSAHKNN